MRKAKSAKKLDFVLLNAIFSTLPLLSAHANQCSNTSDSNSTVTVDSTCTDFSNSANITHRVIQGDDSDASATGVLVEEADYPLNTFINTNTGTIKAERQIGNVTQGCKESRGYGVEIWRDINLFENSGRISSKAEAGNAEADYSCIHASAGGVVINGYLKEFNNSGNFEIRLNVGNATGEDSEIKLSARGVSINAEVETFVNQGNVTVDLRSGDASGKNSKIYVYDKVNMHLMECGRITYGSVIVSLKVGKWADYKFRRILYSKCKWKV